MRDARAFSCVGSGVDDLRLVHAAGEGVWRLPDSASTCIGLAPGGGRRGRAELARSVVVLGVALWCDIVCIPGPRLIAHLVNRSHIPRADCHCP